MEPIPKKLTAFARVPDWHFSAMLVLEVIFIFIALPALHAGGADHGIVLLLQTLMAAAAIFLILQTTAARLIVAAIFAGTLLGRFLPGALPHLTTLAVFLGYQAVLTGAVATAVLAPGRINKHRIAGAVFVYLNLALVFAVMFAALMEISPGAITGAIAGAYAYQMLHFSFAMLTGSGTGPLAAHSPFAQSLGDAETVIGQLFPAILLARLVGLHISGKQTQ